MNAMVPGAVLTIVPLVAVFAFIVWALGSLMASSAYTAHEKRRRAETGR